jgi:hypothetical protein
VDELGFFHKPGEHSNSVGIVIKHVAGNLASRWTDLLDGLPWPFLRRCSATPLAAE